MYGGGGGAPAPQHIIYYILTIIGERDTYRGKIEKIGMLIYLFVYNVWTYVCHFVL